MKSFENYGDALHTVLPYMIDTGFSGEINSHFPDIVQRYMPLDIPWMNYTTPQKRHVMRGWGIIWKLAQEADKVDFEPYGHTGKRPDMQRLMGKVWQVLEFKTTNVQSSNQKSRLQIRDAMRALRRRIDTTMTVEGYRIFFPGNPDVPLLPMWTQIFDHDNSAK